MNVCIYVCWYEFPDDNKQETLELNLFKIFHLRTIKCVIFAAEASESTNIIFHEYLLNDPDFRLVAIVKSINKMFEKQLQRNPFLR